MDMANKLEFGIKSCSVASLRFLHLQWSQLVTEQSFLLVASHVHHNRPRP